MLFEGAEKKAHIYIDNDKLSLLTDINVSFWRDLVATAGAKILSVTRNDDCHAYLLSESSLLVWHDHFIIMTCGITRLANAVEHFIKSPWGAQLKRIEYQRKNEYFSTEQPSCFLQDIDLLNQYRHGEIHLFGRLSDHHNRLFIADFASPTPIIPAYEVLAYHLNKTSIDFFTQTMKNTQELVNYLHLDRLLNGFIVDDHFFTPYGYSLNAIRGKKFLTIHITPQHQHSYFSVISNFDIAAFIAPIVNQLEPSALDVLSITKDKVKIAPVAQYLCLHQEQQLIEVNRHVNYCNFRRN